MTPETARRWSLRDAGMGAVLVAALILLAVLQYRWIGQVREADRDRLQRELRTALSRFTDDFDSEFDRLIQVLSNATPGSAPASDQATLASRVELWRGLAAHPQMVKQVWLAESPELPDALRRLSGRLWDNPAGGRPGGRGGRFPVLVDASVPAFAITRTRWNPQSTEKEAEKQRWLIVELDPVFIRKTWLPELVMEDFGQDYHVRIFGGLRPDTVAFETANAPTGLGADGIAAPLFALRQSFNPRGQGSGPPDGGRGQQDKGASRRKLQRLR